MDTRHLVDPELAPLLELWPAFALDAETLPAIRTRELPRPPMPPVDVRQDRAEAAGRDGAPAVPLHIYRTNSGAPLPCIYHIHGGGYVAGAASELQDIHRTLADDLDCAIVSVDYRLAPETCFPGNLEDCYAGLAWVMDEAAALGIDAGRVGVMGESAGGGLAAGLALLARDRSEYALAFQHLIYPMLDDRTCTTTDPHPYAGEFLWDAPKNLFGWTSLLGHAPGGEGVSPYAAPARTTDLSGLPTSYVATGALDLFLDEDIDYAQRLLRAGVPTELHVYPGAFHAFNLMPNARVADAARRDSTAALRRALHG